MYRTNRSSIDLLVGTGGQGPLNNGCSRTRRAGARPFAPADAVLDDDDAAVGREGPEGPAADPLLANEDAYGSGRCEPFIRPAARQGPRRRHTPLPTPPFFYPTGASGADAGARASCSQTCSTNGDCRRVCVGAGVDRDDEPAARGVGSCRVCDERRLRWWAPVASRFVDRDAPVLRMALRSDAHPGCTGARRFRRAPARNQKQHAQAPHTHRQPTTPPTTAPATAPPDMDDAGAAGVAVTETFAACESKRLRGGGTLGEGG